MFGVGMDEFWLNASLADGVDILILASLIALLLRWWRRRRNPAVLLGSTLLVALYAAAFTFDLYMTRALLQIGLPVVLFALIVLFQDDLRLELERFLNWRPLLPKGVTGEKSIDTIAHAVQLLASERIGALLVFPGQHPIDRHCRAGTRIDAELSTPLLHSIFHPQSQGHDGAVIVMGERIDRIGVHLPLSTDLTKIQSLGTRHCAALGLAERTDAMILVVSEERGSITLASQGQLRTIENAEQLREQLHNVLHNNNLPSGKPSWTFVTLEQLSVAFVSLSLAFLLWYTFSFQVQTIQQKLEDVAVELHNVPDGWSIDGPYPADVSITLVGPQRAFDALNTNSLKVVVDLQSVPPDQSWIEITAAQLELPEDIVLHRVEPSQLNFELQKLPSD